MQLIWNPAPPKEYMQNIHKHHSKHKRHASQSRRSKATYIPCVRYMWVSKGFFPACADVLFPFSSLSDRKNKNQGQQTKKEKKVLMRVRSLRSFFFLSPTPSCILCSSVLLTTTWATRVRCKTLKRFHLQYSTIFFLVRPRAWNHLRTLCLSSSSLSGS